MRLSARSFLVSLQLVSCAIAAERVVIELPRHPPDIQVKGPNGKPIVAENAEAQTALRSSIRLTVNPKFQPHNEQDAACELIEMLPSDYRGFLSEHRHQLRATGMVLNHREESRRLYDLAKHLEKTWGSDWSNETDRVGRVINLLFLFDSCSL